MTIEAEVTLPLILSEQEYKLILLFRKLGDERKEKLVSFAEALSKPIRGMSGADFIRSIDTLRAAMTPEEIAEFTKAIEELD